MSDPTPRSYDPALSRRKLLVSGAAGAAGLYGLRAGRAFGGVPTSLVAEAAGTVSFGSNASDPVPKAATAAVLKAFTQKTGTKVAVNSVDHNTFQQQINTYLQGRPQDVFTWFAGYRMQFFAQKGLLTPIDDVWQTLAPQFSSAMQAASKGLDGHYYFVPIYNYPWAVFYRKSVFKQHGYAVPTTWDQFITLAKKMKTDGLTPIAFTDKDGWPAMGTFDILNMRINGYQFHVDLMAHKQSWNSDQVKKVFDTWKESMPYHQAGALGRKWQDAADAIGSKKAGMYVIGSDQIAAQLTGAAAADLDFFSFPAIDPANGQDAVEAPIDGFMMSKKGAGNQAAIDLLSYLGTGAAQMTYLGSNKADVATAKDANTTGYTDLQKKATQFIGAAKQVSQFLDRDSLPTFASNVMIPALQKFIQNGTFDTSGVEAQAKQLFANP
jgi:multiple sugar transport system substrate-binding protein